MPLADALATRAYEGRVYEHDIDDEPSNRRYKSLVSEWGNLVLWKQDGPDRKVRDGHLGNWNI